MTMQRVGRQQLRGYETSFTVGDGDTDYNTSAKVAAIVEANTGTSGPFVLIWQHTVPAQQMIQWGAGNPNHQANQGFIHFFASDLTTGIEEGVIRLVIANARDLRREIVWEENSQRLHTQTFTTDITLTPTDRNTMVPLPRQSDVVAAEDSLMQIYWSSRIVTTTVDSVGFSIPITVYQ